LSLVDKNLDESLLRHGQRLVQAVQRSSDWQGTERSVDAESIATLWIVFYKLAIGVAISSRFISGAIEFAALTAQ
jgi:hypothetical protein